jgi:hypothetical protein
MVAGKNSGGALAENKPPTARGPGRRFQKGQSGNPGGRPKVECEIRALAQKHGPKALDRLVALMASENERVAVVAAQAILDRAYGKPPQALHFAGDNPVAHLVRVEFVKPVDQ